MTDLEHRLLAAAPLFAAWDRYVREVSHPLTIPGHHRRADAVSPLLGRVLDADVPLYGGLDTVGLTRGTLAEAERRTAAQWGADRCRFSTGGSTHANQAALLAVAGPGDTVLVGRNAHRSTLSALVLCGARPVWLPVGLDPASGLPTGVSEGSVRSGLRENPDAVAVAVVDPSYVGIRSAELAAVADATHEAGAVLVVDQAWAAHHGFHPDYPPHALAVGADLVVTSAHKLLPAFSQAALLLARTERVDPGRLERAVETGSTTSPAGAVLASTDAARALLVEPEGRELLGRAARTLAGARERLRAAGYVVPGPDDVAPHRLDPARLVVLRGTAVDDLTVVAERLQAAGMPVEMADRETLLPMTGLLAPDEAVPALVEVLFASATGRATPSAGTGWTAPAAEQAMTPREAFFAAHETVPAAEAVGRVCAEVVAPYPPGVPVLLPGEVVTAEALTTLAAAAARGTRIAYAADPTLASVTVVVSAGTSPGRSPARRS